MRKSNPDKKDQRQQPRCMMMNEYETGTQHETAERRCVGARLGSLRHQGPLLGEAMSTERWGLRGGNLHRLCLTPCIAPGAFCALRGRD